MKLDKRVTIYDIADRLGISIATVNRALNDKPRVKPETRELVKKTAQEMGFRPNALARSLSRRQLRLGVLGFTSFPEFHDRFIDGAKDAGNELRDFNVTVDYFTYDNGASDTPESEEYLHERMQYFIDEKYDGVLLLARQTDDLQLLKDKGIYIAAAVNDLERDMRQFYVCYNGFVAGRMAAELIYRLLPDRSLPVAIASGWKGTGIHTIINSGFRKQMETTPLNLYRVYHNHDNENIAYEATLKLLDECPGLGAIYVNSFNSRGVIRAVKEKGRLGSILLITSDIYAELREYITSGAVTASIFQNQFEQGKRGLHMLFRALTDQEKIEETIMIDPQIVMNSNIELF